MLSILTPPTPSGLLVSDPVLSGNTGKQQKASAISGQQSFKSNNWLSTRLYRSVGCSSAYVRHFPFAVSSSGHNPLVSWSPSASLSIHRSPSRAPFPAIVQILFDRHASCWMTFVDVIQREHTSQAICCPWALMLWKEPHSSLLRRCVSEIWMVLDFSSLFQFLLKLDLLGPHPPFRIQGCVAKCVLKSFSWPFQESQKENSWLLRHWTFESLGGI